MVYKTIEGYDPAVPYRKFEEYAPRFKDHFFLDRDESGIVTAKWHTNGKEMLWGQGPHKAISQLCNDVHQDPDTEVLIMGGSGSTYVNDFNHPNPPRGPLTAEERYQVEYLDGSHSVEAIVGIEQPTIGVINGSGYHTEYALFCDITLMAEGAKICEPHFFAHAVPGDGVQVAWRETMGIKRWNYAALTCEVITAERALELGMVNEVVPADKIYDRAREIAHEILKTPRVVRMITVQVLREPWKKKIASELRGSIGAELFASTAHGTGHDQVSNGLTDVPGWTKAMRKLGIPDNY